MGTLLTGLLVHRIVLCRIADWQDNASASHTLVDLRFVPFSFEMMRLSSETFFIECKWRLYP
jgi:hypothetical protein